MRHRPWLVVSLAAMLGVLALGAFPVRAYLDQQHQREHLAERLQTLSADNQRLADQIVRLQADDTIERLARDRYQMVRPGEEAFAILPDPSPPAVVPAPAPGPAPAPVPAPGNENWLSRAWSRITSLF